MGRMEFTEIPYYEVNVLLGNGKMHFQKIVDKTLEFKGMSIVFSDNDGNITNVFPVNQTIVNLVSK